MAQLADWVEQLGRDIGMPRLTVRDGAVSELDRGRGAALTFELSGDGETLFLHAPVARLTPPGHPQGVLFETALALHHAAEEPGRLMFGLDPRSERIVAFAALHKSELGAYEAFVGEVDEIAASVDEATHGLDQLDLDGPRHSPVPAPTEMTDPLRIFATYLRA